MAILNVPEISGPSFGGVIYGLSLQMGYSKEPTKLTLDIVNETGNYDPLPNLNDPITISFGSFTFNGIIWSYNIKESSDESVLQVEIIDNSIILDRYYVLLWKRGIFDDNGTESIASKVIDLSDETIVLPVRSGVSDIVFSEQTLGKQTIKRKVYSANEILDKEMGNIIYLGTEKFPDTQCDISETEYTLDDLKNLIKDIVEGVDFSAPDNYKATHEGTLREVLQSWASDCGVDFYWDFSQNKIICYSVEKGININIPKNISDPSLIEQSKSLSLDGTFVQHALAYTAYPREELKIQQGSIEIASTMLINPFPISWFLKNNGTLQSLNIPKLDEASSDDPLAAEKNLWGGRTQKEFLAAAFLGYVDEGLRDLILSTYKTFKPLGITIFSPSGGKTGSTDPLDATNKEKVLDYLKATSPQDVADLEKIDTTGLPNYNFFFCVKNDALNAKWKQIEQEILGSYGSIYRHNIRPSTTYFCSKTVVTQCTSTVDPAPEEAEPKSGDYRGQKIFRRGGNFSHSQGVAAEQLGLSEDQNQLKLEKAKMREFDIISSKLIDSFPDTSAKTLLIIPNVTLLKKILTNFDIDIGTGGNDMESTAYDADVSSNDSDFKCNAFDENVANSKCVSAKDEAMELETKRLNPNQNNNSSSPSSGLNGRQAKYAEIKIFDKILKIYAPSFSSYQCVINMSLNSDFLSINQYGQKIFFNKKMSGSSDNVASIDVIYDNVTDSGEDGYGKKRIDDLPLAKAISNTSPQDQRSYTFAGFPPSTLELTPSNGLSSVDISYSSEGFKTSVTFSSRPSLRTPVNTFLRKIQSQLNRTTFKAR